MLSERERLRCLYVMELTQWWPRAPLPGALPFVPLAVELSLAHATSVPAAANSSVISSSIANSSVAEPVVATPAVADDVAADVADTGGVDTGTTATLQDIESLFAPADAQSAVLSPSRVHLQSAARPAASVMAPVASQSPVAAMTATTVMAATTDSVRFAALTAVLGDMLLCVELADAALPMLSQQEQRLLQDLLLAFAGVAAEPQWGAAPLRWPVVNSPFLARDRDSAARMLQAHLKASCERYQLRGCLLIGDMLGLLSGDVTALPSLSRLLSEPACKREAWQRMASRCHQLPEPS